MPVCWHWSGSNPPISNWREFAGTECLKSNSKRCLRSWFYTGISHRLAGCAAWRSGTPELHTNAQSTGVLSPLVRLTPSCHVE